MTVEILGGRMLAPVFGSGIEVWGSIISVFLLSLSLGYFLGGFLSQKRSSIDILIRIVVLAGILISVLPLYYNGLTIRLWGFGPRLGPLIASILLFFPPSVLLGMVSPYSIHLSTKSIASVGVNSGFLYAVSTIGSFLGCIVTSFYFITMMGITKILFASGLLLIAVAAAGLLASGSD
ncbi:MAG: fused MFS/spermidine synthase [Desulfobacterales bacterium]|nr:fused MFS/spermidine synthase [Desulfobacterales bacterium]